MGCLSSTATGEEKGGHPDATVAGDSCIVDINRFSSLVHVKHVDANAKITKTSISRKGIQLQRGGGGGTASFNLKKDRDPTTTSPIAAALRGASTPEKPMVMMVGATDHSSPQTHNSIIIINCGSSGGGGAGATTESKLGGRRFSFRRPTSSWTIDPRRILFFFATISSMGTILLIYFTLSMSKLNRDDSVN